MASVGSNGIFGDQKSGGGLFRDHYIGNSGGGATKLSVANIHTIGKRDSSEFFDDFITTLIDPIAGEGQSNWDLTITTSGTAVNRNDRANGECRLSGTAANQGVNAFQFSDAANDNSGAFLDPTVSRVITYEVRATLNALELCDWYIGLGNVDTAFMNVTNGALDSANDFIGFHHVIANNGVPNMTSSVDGNAVIETALGSGVNTFNSTVPFTLVNDVVYKFGIRITDFDKFEFYIDDKLVHRRLDPNNVAWSANVTPTFALTGQTAATRLDIDYVLATQTRIPGL